MADELISPHYNFTLSLSDIHPREKVAVTVIWKQQLLILKFVLYWSEYQVTWVFSKLILKLNFFSFNSFWNCKGFVNFNPAHFPQYIRFCIKCLNVYNLLGICIISHNEKY